MQEAHRQREAFKSIVSEIKEHYLKTDTRDMLDQKSHILQGLLGDDFGRAMSVFDSQEVTVLTDEFNRKMFMTQVSKGKFYFIFNEVDYCTCQSFKHRILKSCPDSFSCKHIINARIADALSRCTARKISHEKLSELLYRPIEFTENGTEIVMGSIRIEMNEFLSEKPDQQDALTQECTLNTQRSGGPSLSQIDYTPASQLLQDLGLS